jgi:hypothetical protein
MALVGGSAILSFFTFSCLHLFVLLSNELLCGLTQCWTTDNVFGCKLVEIKTG